jgi:asparagine synthase (glutamine-hydrolysing)
VGNWFRNELKADLVATLAKRQLEKHGLFNAAIIENLIKEHVSKQQDHTFKLWTIYCFQKWYDHQY